MTETTLDPRRVWLDELLAKPHLWPSQVATAQVLAAELGIQIAIWDLNLEAPERGWQRRSDHATQ